MNTTAALTADTILTGDCLTLLPTLPAGLADLVYLDPPFNIGLSYPGYDDDRPPDEYFAWLQDVFRAVLRVLAPHGSLWVQCGQTIQAEIAVMLKRLGMHWRNSIIWHFTFGQHQTRRFVPSHQVIHGFTVHPRRFMFNADAVRVPSARQLVYRDKRANPKGRVPGDVWEEPRINGTFHRRIKGHSCQTPLEIIEPIIKACSHPGDLLLDPMAGTGSACVAAAIMGRRFIGIELCEETAEKARQRIDEALRASAG